MPNNRLHKGAQKRGGRGNSDFFIKRASNTVRIAFVPCEAERYTRKKMNKSDNFSQIGGVRLNSFNASWPFARITVSPEMVEVKCFLKKYHFTKDQIIALREYDGIFSKGLLLEHTLNNYPHHMVFWTFDFHKLKIGLEGLGYVVYLKASDT